MERQDTLVALIEGRTANNKEFYALKMALLCGIVQGCAAVRAIGDFDVCSVFEGELHVFAVSVIGRFKQFFGKFFLKKN